MNNIAFQFCKPFEYVNGSEYSNENDSQISPCYIPPGNILSQTYLYESDIEDAIDHYCGYGTYGIWRSTVGSLVSLVDIEELVGKTNISTKAFATLASWVFSTALSIAESQSEQWWSEAYRDIVNGVISCVRYTIVENTSDYPKVWRIFERI